MALPHWAERWGPIRLLIPAEQHLPPHRLGRCWSSARTRAAVHVVPSLVSRPLVPLVTGHHAFLLPLNHQEDLQSCLADALVCLIHLAAPHVHLRWLA